MYYCLNKEELIQLIAFRHNNKAIESPDLAKWIEMSCRWEVELGCISYLFAQILEKRMNGKQNHSETINLLNAWYDFAEQMYLHIHECDQNLIDYMMGFLRTSNLSIEEELVNLHFNMCEYNYV